MKFFAERILRGLVLAVASLLILTSSETSVAQVRGLYRIEIPPGKTLKSFFRYTPGRIPFVSTHRGGARQGFPENSISTFENTLRNTWSILEIDPRYTKDSVIVLMHDATLDRTSTGTGSVADHTFEQIRELRLKDVNGEITKEHIPTLDEAIRWARNKTILVVDQKDVPVGARVKKIQQHGAQSWVVLIVYSLEDAKKCYSLDPDIVMELMVPDKKAMSDIENAGIPWENVVAFVTHTTPKDTAIFRELHDKGVMCIRGSSRTIDKEYTEGKIGDRKALFERYRKMVASGTDIIEADLGIEAGQALKNPGIKDSAKSRFFSGEPAGADPPEAVITNGLLSAKLYLPDRKNGYYRGARFDWAGVISSLEYKNHSYFGKWFEKYDPFLHDAIMGPVDEFRIPLGFDEAGPGEEFVKIGVGLLRRPDSKPYSFSMKYEVTDSGDWQVDVTGSRVGFSQRLKSGNGYAYVYEKVINLTKGEPQLVIAHRLTNTGNRPITTNTYNHNFFMIDREQTGPGISTTFDFDIAAKGGGFGDIAHAKGRSLTFTRQLQKGEHVFCENLKVVKDAPAPYSFKVENSKTGAGVQVTGSRPVDTMIYWACPTTACPEPYIDISLKPGETTEWSISYEFYAKP